LTISWNADVHSKVTLKDWIGYFLEKKMTFTNICSIFNSKR
jgi:hypothetical protein